MKPTSSRFLQIKLELIGPDHASSPRYPLPPTPPAPRERMQPAGRKPGKVALGILGLRTHPSLAFLGLGGNSTNDEPEGNAEENIASIWEEDEEEEAEVGQWKTETTTDGEADGDAGNDGSDDEESDSTFAAGAEAVRSTISRVGGEWTRFTQDVSEATEGLLAAVDKAGASVGDAADAVAEATSGVRSMTSDEVALTALLLKQLAAGGGPTPDQVLQLVQKCEREGSRPQKGMSRCSETMTVGDLIIPGNVRWTSACCVAPSIILRGCSCVCVVGAQQSNMRECGQYVAPEPPAVLPRGGFVAVVRARSPPSVNHNTSRVEVR